MDTLYNPLCLQPSQIFLLHLRQKIHFVFLTDKGNTLVFRFESRRLTALHQCCAVPAQGVDIWEIAEVWRVIPGKIVCSHMICSHNLRMLETAVAAIHLNWPGAQKEKGNRGWNGLAWLHCLLGSKQKNNCLARYCRSISSGRNDTKTTPFTLWFTSVMCQDQNPFPNHCFFPSTTSALHLIYHFLFLCFLFYFPHTEWFTHTGAQLSRFPLR